MIDMRHIYKDDTFKSRVAKFKRISKVKKCEDNQNCKWSLFKAIFLELAKCKCPICEKRIGKYDDIDHYRPKDKELYPFLKCCYKNYMVMCTSCNRERKGNKFPLYTSYRATSKRFLKNEKPLLINPTVDNIYNFFKLEFGISKGKRVLLLKPNNGLNDYEQKRAETTLEIYGLGNCEKIASCRIDVMETHYENFLDLAEIYKEYFKDESKENELKIIKFLMRRKKLKTFGFYEFIKQNRFEINPRIYI